MRYSDVRATVWLFYDSRQWKVHSDVILGIVCVLPSPLNRKVKINAISCIHYNKMREKEIEKIPQYNSFRSVGRIYSIQIIYSAYFVCFYRCRSFHLVRSFPSLSRLMCRIDIIPHIGGGLGDLLQLHYVEIYQK